MSEKARQKYKKIYIYINKLLTNVSRKEYTVITSHQIFIAIYEMYIESYRCK